MTVHISESLVEHGRAGRGVVALALALVLLPLPQCARRRQPVASAIGLAC